MYLVACIYESVRHTPYYSRDRLVRILRIVRNYRGWSFVGEEFSYSVKGSECYFEFCLSEEFGNVERLLAYIGEGFPSLLRCAGWF